MDYSMQFVENIGTSPDDAIKVSVADTNTSTMGAPAAEIEPPARGINGSSCRKQRLHILKLTDELPQLFGAWVGG
ncbi:hypothetical protein BsWGS_28960 [Bradybaena similaris]